MENPDFEQLLQALRRGDRQAVETLLRRYDDALRRVIRLRLRDPRLRRILDTTDICHSVIADFLARYTADPSAFQDPEELRRLLVTMALNKLRSRARKESRNLGSLPADVEILSTQTPVPEALAREEMLQAVIDRLTEDERWLVEQRMAGRKWDDLAREKGTTAAALRVKQARALARVRRELQLEEARHER
jgi:RNA polymerase sigma-70 factor (ECF subfamily)